MIFFSVYNNAKASDAKVYILCYHAFLDRKDPYSLTEDVLKEQLVSLKAGGFTFVSMEDIKADRVKGEKNILVTIDDGNKSTYPAYFNVMKPLGVKPMLGIYPAIIGRTSYALTWEQLKELSDEGCYIAAHGYNHLYVGDKAWKESPAKVKREINLSKKRLQEKLGIQVDAFVYPFGIKSQQAVEELKKAGYKYAFTIVPGKTALPAEHNFEIPRFLLTKGNVKSTTARIISRSVKVASQNRNTPTAPGKSLTGARQAIEEKMETIKKNSEILKTLVINDLVVLPGAIRGDRKKNYSAEIIKPEKEPEYPDHIPAAGYLSGEFTENSIKTDSVTDKFKNFLLSLKESYFNILNRFRSMITKWSDYTFSRMSDIRGNSPAIHNTEMPPLINEK